jgi:putative ABC transport system ATP-binding protein
MHHGENDHHEHQPPLKRFLDMLRLDRRDIATVILFAAVGGALSLASPLAVESLVNVVSWGTYVQPLLVLALILLICLGLSGVMRILQTVLVEIIQRRQLVRIVGDLAHRFARANQQALQGQYPRELSNRLFDIMTIQKATAVLLLDGVSLVLTTALGMLLLAFYHPFLLGFDVILLFLMVSITWWLGRGGVRTSIEESRAKYRIVHWLQDVFASPTAFKLNGGEALAIDRANRLVSDYLVSRKAQFQVVIRQVAFAIGLQVIASTVLLGLGGWLVIQQQLTLGQLVASELVVTIVVGAFAKAGKSLEKYYDLMAGMDKVGHLLDVSVDPRRERYQWSESRGEVSWEDLEIEGIASTVHVPAVRLQSGSRVAILGEDRSAKSLLLRVLAGLTRPSKGIAEVAGVDARDAGLTAGGRIVGYAGPIEIFHAPLVENVSLGRNGVGISRVQETLRAVGLWNDVLALPQGTATMLQTGGYPLTPSQASLLVIARAMAARPSVLLIDGLLDDLLPGELDLMWPAIAGPDCPWTLLVVTGKDQISERCDDRVTVRSATSGTPRS